MKILVFLEEEKLTPKGGPYAVGYYYYQEMKRRGESVMDFIHINSEAESQHSRYSRLASKLPSFLLSIVHTIRISKAVNNLLDGPSDTIDIDLNKYDILQFHDTRSMFRYRKQLTEYKGLVLLQSHSPIPLGQELSSDMSWMQRFIMPNLKDRYEKMDRYAFERADYIIFPCKEAEEPYASNWPYFTEIKTKYANKFRYVLTGIEPPVCQTNRTDIRNRYNIPQEAFLISYVGRHNTVKGYDILKNIAKQYFLENDNAWVISAGAESPFKRLDHPRWCEIGFTKEAASIISASDVFLLPNRVTYFDIVMLEILSLGKIVIASRTGGNKFFEKCNVPGIFLYDTIEEAVTILENLSNMSESDRISLGNANKLFFNINNTVSAMYDNYMCVIKDILKK